MIALTKDVGDEFDKNSLYQYKKIYKTCNKLECDKKNFRIGKGRLSYNHYNILETINEKMKNSRKFKYFETVIKNDCNKIIALQSLIIPFNFNDQLKRVLILL